MCGARGVRFTSFMIGLVGLDHHWAPAEVRGRLSFAGERLATALRALRAAPTIAEVVVLFTCNRTEVYVAASDWPDARASVERFLAAAHHLGPEAAVVAVPPAQGPAALHLTTRDEGAAARASRPYLTGSAEESASADDAALAALAPYLYVQEGADAARHLLRVAAGLRSMLLGEPQVLGQVKEALAEAEAAGTVGEELRALFVEAVRVGKRVRAETSIGQSDPSLAAAAVQVGAEALGGLSGKAALVIGAGRTSQLCAASLRAAGVARLVLANRTAESAATLAARVDGTLVALDDVGEAIGDMDLIVSATAAPHVVLGAATIAAGLRGRHRPLVIVDLAVPADVDQAAGLLPQVALYTLDQLGTVVSAEPQATQEADVARAETIVETGVRAWVRARQVRRTVPGIAALRRHVDRSEQQELARALEQLERLGPLSEAERAVITRFGQRLVDKMFHHLVGRIRALAEYDEVPLEVTLQVLDRLFADPDTPDPSRQSDA
jgi:glutamyl-tRNA reductase